MTGFPDPEVGLVISYSYPWKEEEERGQIGVRKDRPCAIILAVARDDATCPLPILYLIARALDVDPEKLFRRILRWWFWTALRSTWGSARRLLDFQVV